jgi:hypothetical protein
MRHVPVMSAGTSARAGETSDRRASEARIIIEGASRGWVEAGLVRRGGA